MEGFDDPGRHPVTKAMRAALPTNRHAQAAVDELLAVLGDRATVETFDGGAMCFVHVREARGSPWFVPWPLVRFSRGRRLDFVAGAGPPTDALPPPKEGAPPRLAGLAGGAFAFSDGVSRFEVVYGDDGRLAECSLGVSVAAFAPLVEALDARRGNAVEAVVDLLLGLDGGAAGPGRVVRPAPVRNGVAGAFERAMNAIRDRSFDGVLAEPQAWFCVDGSAGLALGDGFTRDEAAEACRRKIALLRPEEPPPAPMPDLPPSVLAELGMPDGPVVVRGPVGDAPPAGRDPARIPYAACELPLPQEPHAFGRWVRAVDAFGRGVPLLRRDDANGCTLAAPAALEGVDPLGLDALLDDALRAHERDLSAFPQARGWHKDLPPLTSATWTFERTDEARGGPRFAVRSTGGSYGFAGRSVRPEQFPRGVVRQRNVAP